MLVRSSFFLNCHTVGELFCYTECEDIACRESTNPRFRFGGPPIR